MLSGKLERGWKCFCGNKPGTDAWDKHGDAYSRMQMKGKVEGHLNR